MPRTRSPKRSKFRTRSVAESILELRQELRRFKAAKSTISTNVALRRDGLPYSGLPEPKDSGAAVYFMRKGKPYCIAIDLYDRVADNIHAVAVVIENYRSTERHGGAAIVEQATAGFLALPAPHDDSKVSKLRRIAGDPRAPEGERAAAQRQIERMEGQG